MKTIVLALLCLFSLIAEAPKRHTLQRFGDADMPLIRTKVRFTTVIVLPEGEEVGQVICGDQDYWVIEAVGSLVYVKPAKEAALTNVNIVSKNGVLYSFLVREVTRPGSKERPDLKITLDGDEVTKLRQDKANLEELVLRNERAMKDLAGKAQTNTTKPRPEAVSGDKKATPSNVKGTRLKNPEPPTPSWALPAPPVVAGTPAIVASPGGAGTEMAQFRTLTVERPQGPEARQGLLRKTGKAIGGFFRRIGHALRLY